MKIDELRTTGNAELDEARKSLAKTNAEQEDSINRAKELREMVINGDITFEEAMRQI